MSLRVDDDTLIYWGISRQMRGKGAQLSARCIMGSPIVSVVLINF